MLLKAPASAIAIRGAFMPVVSRTLPRGTFTPDLSNFFSKNFERASMTSIACRRKALIHSFMSWKVGALMSIGCLTTLLLQKVTRKVCGLLDSYKIKSTLNMFKI